MVFQIMWQELQIDESPLDYIRVTACAKQKLTSIQTPNLMPVPPDCRLSTPDATITQTRLHRTFAVEYSNVVKCNESVVTP